MHTHLVVLGARQLDLTEAVEQTRQVAVELDKRNFEGVRELRGHVFQQELNIFLRIRQHHMDDPPQVGCVFVSVCACACVYVCVLFVLGGGGGRCFQACKAEQALTAFPLPLSFVPHCFDTTTPQSPPFHPSTLPPLHPVTLPPFHPSTCCVQHSFNILLFHTGAPASGMNACAKAIVRDFINGGHKVFAARGGFQGFGTHLRC